MHEDGPGARGERVPLFPLHTVLLPGVHLPLHIFEPRYRQLVADMISGELPEREFGVVAIRNALVNDVSSLDQLHSVGCMAKLREAAPQDGGRFDIVTTGARRFELHELVDGGKPYLHGEVQWLPDTGPPETEDNTARALAAAARAAHGRYCESAWADGDWSAPGADVGLDELSYLLAADCLLPLPDRQAVLAERDPLSRLRMVGRLLSREAGFLGVLRAVPAQHSELDALSTRSRLN